MFYTMQTSVVESLNAAGNIFVGMTEAPLMIRPFLAKMTKSEIHAVMTGGFATIAGSYPYHWLTWLSIEVRYKTISRFGVQKTKRVEQMNTVWI